MASTSEKLVYLQNGVFKRKEMTSGLQYYSDGAFDTFPLPPSNGNFVLTNNNNEFTWTDAGVVVPDQPEEFTTIDTSKTATARQSPLPPEERFRTLSTIAHSASSICRVAVSTC